MIFGKNANASNDWLEQNSSVEWLPPAGSIPKPLANYVQDWIARCAERPIGAVAAGNDGSWAEIKKNMAAVDRFGLRINVNNEAAEVSGKFIHTLEISGTGPYKFINCTIKNIEMRQDQFSNVRFENCKIGTLLFRRTSVGTFEMIGCTVRKTFAPTPNDPSPFTGSVEIRRCRFSNVFENAQAYRNLRHHLTALHNHEAASVFHAAEMRAEVGRQSYVDRVVSTLYQTISNYGGSSARPLAIFVLIVLLNFGYIYLTDGAALIGNVDESDGWRFDMYGMDQGARVLRSAVFALSQALNPLGIFGTRLLLSGKTPTIAFISMALGVASTLAFALFVLAIRRRFRLDRSS